MDNDTPNESQPDLVDGASPAQKEAEEGSAVLGNVRTLVRDKTRFEPEDIQPVAEEDILKAFTLNAGYSLEARVETRDINGYFERTSTDHNCNDGSPESAAQAETKYRLKLAGSQLESCLYAPGTPYNAMGAGVLLAHEVKHWFLYTCGTCSGDGRVECHTCHGRKTETCWHCSGGLFVTCDDGCNGSGRINCAICCGSGHVDRQESYPTTVSVPTSIWNGSEHVTSYRTEYRTEYRTVQHPCLHCASGKRQCSRCGGRGHINCPTCFATGNITCRTCSGLGDLTCQPCSGSGEVGEAAWVDVHVIPDYRVLLSDEAADDAKSICDKEGAHGIAAVAQTMSLSRIELDNPECLKHLTAGYDGVFRIVRLDAGCNNKSYHLVAYGNDLRWLTLGDIVEDLLRGDLQALSNALNQIADDSFFSSRIDLLLEPLHAVAASELNAEVVESILRGDAKHVHANVVSPEYVRSIQTAIFGSLRQIYTRLAKQFWWKGALASGVVTMLVWFFYNPMWATLAGLLTIPASFFLFSRRVLRVLTDSLGGIQQAKRAINIAVKGKRNQLAQFLVLAPSAVAVLALGYFLPVHGLLSEKPGAQIAALTQSSGNPVPNTQTESVSVETALKLYNGGKFNQARSILQRLAESGDKSAAGPYGWMILFAEGLPPGSPLTVQAQYAEAKTWIDKGLIHKDIWALAGKGVMLAQEWGEIRDMPRGLDYLKQAANGGHAVAMHFLGMIYVQGFRITADKFEARKWFIMAAEKGRPEDIYNVGLMDWHGEGVNRPDRISAMKLWKKAANMGESRAIQAVAKGKPHNE